MSQCNFFQHCIFRFCICKDIFQTKTIFARLLYRLNCSCCRFCRSNFFQSKSGKIHIFSEGVACDYSEEEATKILSDEEVTALVDMHMGEESATAWGCDLTHEYVSINADYRS